MTKTVDRGRPLAWIALVLCLATFVAITPILVWLVLAAWLAEFLRPLFGRVARVLGGRAWAASVVTTTLLLTVVAPLGAIIVSLGISAAGLVRSVLASAGGRAALEAIVTPTGAPGEHAMSLDPRQIFDLLREHGEQAYTLLSTVAGATAEVLLGVFVLVVSVYTFLVEGPELATWVADHTPLRRAHFERLTAAFHETGRGLLVGMGLTGLAQAILATVTYLALGVPRALVLGFLTLFVSVLPSVGTALVWAPVAAGLALTGRTGAAAILTTVGVVVIGTADNVLRPVFARFGRLDLSSFTLLVAIFGALAVLGPSGLLLGPLLARLAKEALVLLRDERQAEATQEQTTP